MLVAVAALEVAGAGHRRRDGGAARRRPRVRRVRRAARARAAPTAQRRGPRPRGPRPGAPAGGCCQTPDAAVIHHGFRTWGEGKALTRPQLVRDRRGLRQAAEVRQRSACVPVLAHEVVWFGFVKPVAAVAAVAPAAAPGCAASATSPAGLVARAADTRRSRARCSTPAVERRRLRDARRDRRDPGVQRRRPPPSPRLRSVRDADAAATASTSSSTTARPTPRPRSSRRPPPHDPRIRLVHQANAGALGGTQHRPRPRPDPAASS